MLPFHNPNFGGAIASTSRSSSRCSSSCSTGSNERHFVSRGYAGAIDEDDFLMEASDAVFRSTPHQQFTLDPMQMSEREYSMTIELRDDPSPSQMIRKVEFSSIAEEFPLPMIGTSNFMIPRSCAAEALLPTAAVGAASGKYRPTPQRRSPAIDMDRDTTQPETLTILDRSSTIKNEVIEEDRRSPFECAFVPQEPILYYYSATKTEEDEMEAQVFQRYFQLQQKEQQWGTLEVRDNRVFFYPGKRREAIMKEKRFHDSTYQEGIVDGDASWYNSRRAQFAEEFREFCREETKHKQEIMLARLEKSSPFSKFPILGNRFLLVRLLGKGGNGEVWDVIDYVNQKRRCALKLSTSRKHAQREHRTHRALNHPNIVNVGDSCFLIEYRQQLYTGFTVDGVETDLQKLVEMYGHFDEASAFKVLFQLLNALTYLHEEMKIAHYDLKPSNILITKDVCVKLTDFDLARTTVEPIASSTVGTLRYLPPECFRPNFGDCKATAEKADIWMLGIVYSVMLSGKHPICPDKASHDQTRRLLSRYTGHINYPAHISQLSRWILESCLRLDPLQRPTASHLRQAMQSWVPQ